MIPPSMIEKLVFLMVVLLALALVLLAAISPADFTATASVYQGF